MNEMKISDDRLNEIIDKMQIQYQNAPEFDRNFEKDVHDCLLELRSIRNYYAMEEESKRLESQRLCDIERRIEIEGE